MTDAATEHCPYCRQDRNVTEIAQDSYSDHSDPHYSYSNIAHLYKCLTCRDYFMKAGHSNEHDVEHETLPDGSWEAHYPYHYKSFPPEAKRQYPKWERRLYTAHNPIHQALKDIYTSLDAGLMQFSAMGIRSLFEKVAHHTGVAKEKNFAQILTELEDEKLISDSDKTALEVLVEGGHAAMHRGWSPDVADIIVLLDIFEDFIYSTFFKVEDEEDKAERRAALKKKIPPDARKFGKKK